MRAAGRSLAQRIDFDFFASEVTYTLRFLQRVAHFFAVRLSRLTADRRITTIFRVRVFHVEKASARYFNAKLGEMKGVQGSFFEPGSWV